MLSVFMKYSNSICLQKSTVSIWIYEITFRPSKLAEKCQNTYIFNFSKTNCADDFLQRACAFRKKKISVLISLHPWIVRMIIASDFYFFLPAEYPLVLMYIWIKFINFPQPLFIWNFITYLDLFYITTEGNWNNLIIKITRLEKIIAKINENYTSLIFFYETQNF